MNELEDFIVDLSLIEKDTLNNEKKHEKLAEYILSGSGWSILKQIHDNKIQVNFIFADKLNDLLMEYCSKLILNLPKDSKYTSKPDVTDQFQLGDTGTLFDFVNIALELYLKFNDGTINNIFSTTSLSLVKLSDVLFNQLNDTDIDNYLKFVYLKFLHKLFKTNFENISKKISGNQIVQNLFKPNSKLNFLFLEQFKLVVKSIEKLSDLKIFYTNIIVNYVYEFSVMCGFITLGHKSNQVSSTGIFENLIEILDLVTNFVFSSLTEFDLDDFSSIWKRLCQILIELKDYKNKIEHSQTCFRAKHTTHACKKSLNDLNSKHNDISNHNSKCVFEKISKSLFKLLLNTRQKDKTSHILNLIDKFGVCSCVSLDDFIEWQRVDQGFYYNQFLSSCALEFIFNLLKTNTESGLNESLVNKRRSIFFPLLVDTSLVEPEKRVQTEHVNKSLLKKFFEIFSQLSPKSVLLSKYLASSIKKYNKYLTNSFNHDDKETEKVESNFISQSLQYKYMICEIFYMFKDGLKLLAEADKSEHTVGLFEIICHYMRDFLIVTSFVDGVNFFENESLSPTSPSDPMKALVKDYYTSSQHEFEKKTNQKFIDFMNKNSVQIYELTNNLCSKYELSLYDSISICAQLLLHKSDSQSVHNETHLSKSLMTTLDNQLQLLNNHQIISIVLELYIKCVRFRTILNECQHFHLNLLNCFNMFFNFKSDVVNLITTPGEKIHNLSEDNLKYVEVLLDLIFCYFYCNRKRDLNDIYVAMRDQLDTNVHLLIVYFNVMIMSKAFQMNKILQINNPSRLTHSDSMNHRDESDTSYSRSISTNQNHDFINILQEYDADTELSVIEHFNETSGTNRYRYDIILFPRLLDICLNYISHIKREQRLELIGKVKTKEDIVKFNEKYGLFNTMTEIFFKKLIYLLESSNFNIRIIISNNFRNNFIEMIQKPIYKQDLIDELLNHYNSEKQIIQYCFDILFHVCSYDMNESFLIHLLELLVDNQFQEMILENKNFTKSNSIFFGLIFKMKKINSKLLLRLSENLNIVHSTNYLHLPYQNNQDPIDFLLQTNNSTKKWKINLDYQADKEPPKSHEPHLHRMIKESSNKIYYFRIPIKCSQSLTPVNHSSHTSVSELSHHSYSIGFMIRFDDNLINYSKSNGLDNSSRLNNESYVHLFSVNLENELSSFEIWLSPNGNLLFIRRSDQSIIITFNLLQIQPHIWYFVYVNFEEEIHSDKLKCKISYSLNAKEIVEKDFEIYNRHDKPILKHSKSVHPNFPTDQHQNNLYFYIGHQEKKHDISHLFKYDLGQVILSKDANYKNEHLILMMLNMDTNFSLIDQISSYEWVYLNGYCDIKILENIQKNFNEYCDQIKARTIAVYHPRYPHTASIKYANQKNLTSIDLSTSCKPYQQSTLEVCLAKIGGIQQLLVLIAKLIDQEHKIFTETRSCDFLDLKLFDKPPSLIILETLINLNNKRPNINKEFKQMDGYILLQRVFTSIASLNKYLIQNNESTWANYYSHIQKSLFVALINGCFFKPVFSVNPYLPNNDNIEFCYGIHPKRNEDNLRLNKIRSKSDAEDVRHPSSIYVINPQILSQIIIEWELWIPLEGLKNHENVGCLYKYAFQILNKLLDYENKSQVYHSNLFLKFNLLEKLINFLLDANAENFILDHSACSSLINIFKHFNSIFTSSNNSESGSSSITKQLFSNFFDYLYILHPENNVYIVNQKNEFYFNLNLNLLSIPFTSMQEFSKHRNSLVYLEKKRPDRNKESITETSETDEEKRPSESSPVKKTNETRTSNSPSLKGQIINFGLFNDNEYNFSKISSSLMKIMTEMLSVLPDLMVNDILNLLKFESFIMFAMDDNEDKRFEAFKLFLELIERSSTMSFFFTSVASAAGNVVVNVANTTGSLASQTVFSRSFEQQNLSVNKEFLIYSMANQLNKYDQVDVRFMETCISKLINQPFTFDRVLDSNTLKSLSNQIKFRQSYLYIFISLIYSSRKNVDLCKSGLGFLSDLITNEIIRVDYLLSCAGLLQVMINLLKFFSDPSNLSQISTSKQTNLNNDSCTSLPIVNELKQFFCLVARLLLKFNENQDFDLFNSFMNTIINLCFNSANTEYEQLNHNIKSIVLTIIQSIMSDLNSISVAHEASKPSALIKKIIAPLILTRNDTGQNQSYQQVPQALTSNLFESDLIFQKFMIFVVDFLYIVYDKISDSPITDSVYDINDELSIFSFSILTHSLSMGLENNLKGKFSNLFRNNLGIIRLQFRRLLLFLLHPNHKLQTRLQIVKRILNTPNCETLIKFVLSMSDQSSLSYNSKLSFYLNLLMNSNTCRLDMSVTSQAMANNDKEILSHLNQILINSGLNYKTEVNAILSREPSSEASISEPMSLTESSYLIVNLTIPKKSLIDLTTQLDKEFDDEILKIYNKSRISFNSFSEQYDRLAHDLNDFSCNLTNQVVLMHSSVRKQYYQRLKLKFIKSYDIKQKWINLIENMTHEKCLWFDVSSWPLFEILDQTEGPNRERRRLKKSHLYIDDRFFKNEFKTRLHNEKCPNSLKYLLNNYEDYLSLSQNDKKDSFDSTFTTNYMLSHWKNSEIICYPSPCKSVMPYCEITGQLLLTETRINFAADEKNYKYLMGMENVSYSWSYDDIKEIHLRRYLLKDIGIEIFLVFGQTILLAFSDPKDRNDIYRLISGRRLKNLIRTESIDEVTNLWKESKISNYEYLMQLNKYSGRTFNDLMQYPIYPHVLSNYSTQVLDLALKENFRDLSKPIAVQYKEREEKFLENFRMLSEANNEAYHYASLYSNSGTVLHYLVRLPPFTKMFLDYQDQNFDVPDRTFHSMQTSWLLSSTVSTTDYKELIPEFYFLHEFLTNRQGFNFGTRQNGDTIDNVVLPSWSKSNPRLFIIIMRQALESTNVTLNLNSWIDLVWGYKQSGRAALDAINCYHPACYFGYPVEQISDPVQRKAIETMIKTWGQTPKQLFNSSHPYSSLMFKRSNSLSLNAIPEFKPSFNFSKDSIHNLVLNVKWGSYVGSLEQTQSPVCVWKENCKKNIVCLTSLVSNEVIGLTQQKCLLLERVKENGYKNMENLPAAVLEWGSVDDFIKVKPDVDKPSYNLVPIRSNEQTVVCCSCIGSDYLIVGMRSGLVTVYKLKKERSQILCDSFTCNLYGHKQEITDINVCLSFSTMVTASQDGLLIIWDTNKLTYVNSIHIKNQFIYKVSISETTNEIAFIGNTPNKLYFYTGNCDLIGEKDALCDTSDQNENIFMKSLCFSNFTEGLNVNVIAVGLSNGKIRFYSTWDLTLLREISIIYDTNTMIGSIISLTFTKDGKRLYASDTYARVYILEAANSQAALAKMQQSQLLTSINTILSSITVTSPNYSPNLVYYSS